MVFHATASAIRGDTHGMGSVAALSVKNVRQRSEN